MVVKEKMVGGIAQVSLSYDTVGDSVTCTLPLPLPLMHIFLSHLALHPSDYRSTGRDASEGTRAGRGSEKARPDPATAVQVLAFRASRRALRSPVYLMQTPPRDCACHYQSLLGCSGPKLPNPSTPPKCLPNPGPGPAQSHCKPCPLSDSQVPLHPRAPKCLPPSRVLTLQEYY